LLDLSGSSAADVMIVDPTAPSYIGLDDVKLFRQSETLKREKRTFQRRYHGTFEDDYL
jgi:hypothetical protein